MKPLLQFDTFSHQKKINAPGPAYSNKIDPGSPIAAASSGKINLETQDQHWSGWNGLSQPKGPLKKMST